MEKLTFYTVMTLGDGDIFKGYKDNFISSHLSKKAADIVAERGSGRYVEEEKDYLHESFIQKMERDDAIIMGDYCIA